MKSTRQNKIVELLEVEGSVSTERAAEYFSVSLATIRRDFDELERAGILIKKYGYAELSPSHAHTLLPFRNRQGISLSAKKAIAALALDYVSDGSIIALDAGSTVYEFCKLLCHRSKLLAICDDIYTADQILRGGENRVYMLGGFLTSYGTSSGSHAESFISSMTRIDTFFCSCDGCSVEYGMSTDEQMLNDIKRLYVKKAKKKIALIDSTKFQKNAIFKMCDFKDIDVLITDSSTPDEIISSIKKMGVEVKIAEIAEEQK